MWCVVGGVWWVVGVMHVRADAYLSEATQGVKWQHRNCSETHTENSDTAHLTCTVVWGATRPALAALIDSIRIGRENSD